MGLFFRTGLIVGILFLICPILIFGAGIDDPAMEFYLNKTDSALNSSTLFGNNLKYAVQIKSIYQKISYRGITADSDTANFLIEAVDGLFNVSQIVDSAGLEENIIPSSLDRINELGYIYAPMLLGMLHLVNEAAK